MCQFGIISNLHPAYVKVIYNHVAAVISLAVLAIVLGLLHWKKILIFKE
jgi:ABC-type transport system involved in cytochrome bd biosynthesis fused ATPase/permease subunit